MLLLLCIICNVLLAVIFKSFDRFKIDNLNAIIINYLICILFASLLLGDLAIPIDLFSKPWWQYSVFLAILFIFGFNIMALSFQKSGVALTVIIQKMSLIIPCAVAIAIYGEPLGWMKGAGISIALIAIVLVNIPSKDSSEEISLFHPLIIYPLLTFLLSGIIEVVLYYVEAEGLVGEEGMQFTASAFGCAALMGILYSSYRAFAFKIKPGVKELLGGIALGLPNYLTIYLLVFLLSKGWQGSILFPMNSIGILILTALVGFIFYKEPPEKMKIIGIGLGALAILFISQS